MCYHFRMAFTLTVAKLEGALGEPGCAVCRLGREAARRAIDAFLWEHVNDPVSRQPIIDAYGFCPEHTRLLVAIEMASSGPVLGVNIIYEHLGRLVSRDLGRLRRPYGLPGGVLAQVKRWVGRQPARDRDRVLPARGECPGCKGVSESESNYLTTLFEVLEQDNSGLAEIYRLSDGICFNHLRTGLAEAGARYSRAGAWLIEDARARLERQSADMLEYIRKNHWQYRDETISPDEATAWRKTLTFFTGLPGERFNFQIEE